MNPIAVAVGIVVFCGYAALAIGLMVWSSRRLTRPAPRQLLETVHGVCRSPGRGAGRDAGTVEPAFRPHTRSRSRWTHEPDRLHIGFYAAGDRVCRCVCGRYLTRVDRASRTYWRHAPGQVAA